MTAIPAVPSEPPLTDEAAVSDAELAEIARLIEAADLRDPLNLTKQLDYSGDFVAILDDGTGVEARIYVEETADLIVAAVNALPRLVASLRSTREERDQLLASLTEVAPSSLGAQLAEARMWARHGYEIGQRSCLWADHGVAPAWLTEGWPIHFEADPLLQENLKLERALEAAREEVTALRARGDDTDAALEAALDGWSPDRPPAEGVQQLAEERDQRIAESERLGDFANAKVQEIKEIRNNRLISAIFGHHPGAPRPFGLYRREDETGISGTGIVALGAEFPDGMVVLRWASDFPTSVVFHERGIESVEAIHGHGGKTQVVWLSDELEPLAEAEQENDRLRAALAGAEQATTDARLTTVWWAFDDSEGDAWEANAVFADEQHALAYALDAWAKAERNRCEDHDDEESDADCEDCQGMAAYVARLEWRKIANRWELWDRGIEPQWKPSWSGVTVAPNKVHWPEALAADVPATPRARCPYCCRSNDGRSIEVRDGRYALHLTGWGGDCGGSGKTIAELPPLADVPAAADDHEHPGGYLSTACLHDLHEPECGAAQRARGDHSHPHCKYCGAKCVCPCHAGGQVERAERVHADGCTLAADDPHHAGWCVLAVGAGSGSGEPTKAGDA